MKAMARAVAVGMILAGAAHAAPPAMDYVEVAFPLTRPTQIANAGDGSNRLFIVEQLGTIRIWKDGALLSNPFLDITPQVSNANERGLLSIAFDPAFKQNRRFYVTYAAQPGTDPGGELRIASFTVDPNDPNRADPATETLLMAIPHPHNAHFGSNLFFGADGKLYIATGDGGSGSDLENNSQTDGTHLGKFMRIDTTVPGGAPVELAKGFRNPWRWSFDKLTGDVYIGDVGQNRTEEVNFIPAGVTGRNFGWPIVEGSQCYNPPTGCDPNAFTASIVQYPHDGDGFKSVTGGFVYRGTQFAQLRGYYLYADFIDNRLWALRREGASGTWVNTLLTDGTQPFVNVSSFGQDESGELYLASYGNGRMYKVVPRSLPYRKPRVDLDGDTRSDLLWQHTDGRVAAWLMNGAVQAGGGMLISTPGTGWSIVATGDFNGDGKQDLLWQHTDGRVAMWLMSGTTQVGAVGLRAAGSGWNVAFARDFDGDGKDDILWTKADGSAEMTLMDGVAVKASAVEANANMGWTPSVVADFNGDGKADIVWHNTDGRALMTLMNGTSYFDYATLIPGGTGWMPVLAASVNGAAKADIVWQHTDGRVALWVVDGTTQVGGGVLFAGGSGWSPLLRADIDGDGRSDLIFQHTDGSAAYWLLNGATQVGGARVLPSGSRLRIVRADDFEGDARADLVIRNLDDGSVQMWTGEGVAFVPRVLLPAATGWSALPD